MFVVATIMTVHAGTLLLAARYEAVADLVRLGKIDEAAALLAKPIAFPSIVRPLSGEDVRDAARGKLTGTPTKSSGLSTTGDSPSA